MKRILFVCSANKERSITAEMHFRTLFPDLSFDSGGTNHKICFKEGTTPLNEEQVDWADHIYAMEEKHRKLINQHSGGKYRSKIEVLGIADRYTFMQKELIILLEEKLSSELENMI